MYEVKMLFLERCMFWDQSVGMFMNTACSDVWCRLRIYLPVAVAQSVKPAETAPNCILLDLHE